MDVHGSKRIERMAEELDTVVERRIAVCDEDLLYTMVHKIFNEARKCNYCKGPTGENKMCEDCRRKRNIYRGRVRSHQKKAIEVGIGVGAGD